MWIITEFIVVIVIFLLLAIETPYFACTVSYHIMYPILGRHCYFNFYLFLKRQFFFIFFDQKQDAIWKIRRKYIYIYIYTLTVSQTRKVVMVCFVNSNWQLVIDCFAKIAKLIYWSKSNIPKSLINMQVTFGYLLILFLTISMVWVCQ